MEIESLMPTVVVHTEVLSIKTVIALELSFLFPSRSGSQSCIVASRGVKNARNLCTIPDELPSATQIGARNTESNKLRGQNPKDVVRWKWSKHFAKIDYSKEHEIVLPSFILWRKKAS